jgi:ketosteroid isomerase-like protein
MANDFDAFFEERRFAASAYARGDAVPLDTILAKSGSASFHAPRGDTVVGVPEVAQRYVEDAASFGPNGTSRLEVLQIASEDTLGFWTGFQIATVNLPGKSEPVNMRIRVTEVFRKADGMWKIIHRHADFAKEN